MRYAAAVSFTTGGGLVQVALIVGLVGAAGFPCLAPCAGALR